MREILFSFLPAFLTAFLTRLILSRLRKDKSEHSNTVCFPRGLFLFGVFCVVFSPSLSVLCWLQEHDIALTAAAFLFAIPGGLVILQCINWKIEYKNGMIQHRNLWRVTRTYFVSDLNDIESTGHGFRVQFNEKSIRIDEFARGKKAFIDYLKKEYRKSHNGASVPVLSPSGRDLFNGHISNPKDILFGYGLVAGILLIIVGVMVFRCISFSVSVPTEQVITVTSCDVTESNVFLYSEEYEKPHSISFYDRTITGFDQFLQRCNDSEQLIMTAVEQREQYSVRSIHALDGTCFLSSETMYSVRMKNDIQLVLVFAGILAFWLCFCAMSVYVGRNPNKFKKWFVHLFFQEHIVRY